MNKFSLKTSPELEIMSQGGKILHGVKLALISAVKVGASGQDLENLANKLIKQAGAEASFAKVSGYKWVTCININDIVVHGIPNTTKFRNGDCVGIDVGVYYKGFHTDTSTSVIVGKGNSEIVKFLDIGKKALKLAITQAKPGKRIMDISNAMQTSVEKAGYNVVRALTGHGIGRNLHEEPYVPCFEVGSYNNSPKLTPGMVLAIEIMYNAGTSDVVYKNDDGWTIATADGKISGLFEETVAITKDGPAILT
jgi:methionyl aminopeptidase